MNNTFYVKRFWWLFKKTLWEKPFQTFGFTALVLVIILVLYVALKSIWGFGAAQNIAFIWGLPGGAFFLAAFVFGHFSSNASGSSYLTLPASHFEKWLCGILIAGILFPALFLLFFRVMDAAFVTAYHNSLDPASPFYKQNYEDVFVFDLTGRIAKQVYSIFLILSGAMFTGALYFNKSAFIKTAIATTMFFVLLFLMNWLLARIFFGSINDAAPFQRVVLPVGKEEGSLEVPTGWSVVFNYSVWFIIPAIFWVLAFTRLREKEF
jgi:hypothetical protein